MSRSRRLPEYYIAEADVSVSGRKVFGIGFHKTGTTSLGVALQDLGYTTCGGAGPIRDAIGHPEMMRLLRDHQLEPIMRVADHYDAFTDNPWFILFRELDQRFPGSKFILTVRDERRWIESAARYFGDSDSDLRTWIYGSGRPMGNEERWLERYREHITQVKAHFRDRSDDLLIVDWERGSGWDDLGRFLGRTPPSRPFPHLTKPRRPRIDLTGAMVVLTQPRTGSSLVMQTLRLLGAAVIGTVEHARLPLSANPKGFFEDPDILRRGLEAPVLLDRPAALRGQAVKLALHPIVRRASDHEWATLAHSDAALLLPIRTPAEWLVSSETTLCHPDDPPARRAAFFRGWARNYFLDIGYLADRVCAPGFSRAAPICIDYRQAVTDPSGYVIAVAAAAGLRPSSSQVAQAVANIDHGLYRTRATDLAAVRRVAAGVRPLDAIHALLQSQDPSKWERVRDALPAWVFAREAADGLPAADLPVG
jgi:hypothetical protein